MTPDHLVRLLQMTGAALAIPAAAAGTFAAYQSYFSTDVTCQKLRNDIVGIMERNGTPTPSAACSRRTSRNSTSFAAKAIPTRGRFSKRR